MFESFSIYLTFQLNDIFVQYISLSKLIWVAFYIHITAHYIIQCKDITKYIIAITQFCIYHYKKIHLCGTWLYFWLNLEVRFTVSYWVQCYVMKLCPNVQHILLILFENLWVPFECHPSSALSFRDPPPNNPFLVYLIIG